MSKKTTAPRHMREWSEHDVKKLRKYASDGLSARLAGVKLKRSTGAVKYKAMVEGVEFHFINQPANVQKKLARRRIKTGRMDVTLRPRRRAPRESARAAA